MSAQEASPDQQEVNADSNEQSHTAENMTTLKQLPKDIGFSGINGGDARPSTHLLHPSKDNMPAITLTSYHLRLPDDAAPPSKSAFQDCKFVNTSLLNGISIGSDIASSKAPSPALIQLRGELDEHFTRLKEEFEEKTGRAWVPLKGWEREEWDGEWE